MTKITESVWKLLVDNGFNPANEEDYIVFKFEMITFYYAKNDKDECYFQLFLPLPYSVNDENRVKTMEIMNQINAEYKVLKASMSENDNVYLSVEMFMDAENPDFETIFMRVLSMSSKAQMEFMMLV